jgi:hypothetical protein
MHPEPAYPYPIAVALAALASAEATDDVDARFGALLDVQESVVRMLALLGLASYVDRGPQSASVDMLLQRRFLAKAQAAADWGDLLHQLVRPLRSSADRCALPDLVRFWIKATGRLTPHAQALSRMATLRAKWEQRRLNSGEAQRAYTEFRPQLEAALDELGFLRKLRLYVPLGGTPVDRGHLHVQSAIGCMGVNLTRMDVDLVVQTPVRIGQEVVVQQAGNRAEVLRLYPLLIPRVGVAGLPDDLFVYDKNRRANYARALVTRLDYRGARTKEAMVVDRASARVSACHAFMERMGRWITENPEVEEVEPIADDAVFSEPEPEPAPFVGRSAVVDGLLAAVRDAAPLVVIVGASGAGKTALARHLAAQLNPSALHLVSRVMGRDEPRLVVRSLLAQVLRRTGRFGSLPESLAAGTTQLHRQLAEGAGPGQTVLLVVDDIDRLAGANGHPGLDVVPHERSKGVTWVVTCAPGPVADALSTRRGAKRVDLAPMDELELALLVDGDKTILDTAHREVACAAAQGTPLAARVLSMGGGSIATEMPDAFGARAARVAPAAPGVDGRLLCTYLAASGTGLSALDVARLFDVSPPTGGAALRALGPLLRRSGERFRLFHREAESWALSQHGESGHPSIHDRLADLLRSEPNVLRMETLVHSLDHLERSGRHQHALEQLEGEFLRGKMTVLGSPEAIRGDLARGVHHVGNDLVRGSRLALTAALLTRAAGHMASQRVLAAMARHGDPRTAAGLARAIDDPVERAKALCGVAEQGGEHDPDYAAGLTREAGDPVQLSTTAGQSRAATLAREALKTRPGSSRPAVQKAVAAALEDVGRELRIRTLVGAASGLRPERVMALARRALAEIQAEPSEDVQGQLLACVVAALRRVSPEDAVQAAELLPRGGHRVAALLAAGQLARAESEARSIRKPAERERALCAVMTELAQSDPVRAMAGARQLGGGDARDEILRTLAGRLDAELAVEAASLVRSAPLQAAALAAAGAWDEAAAVVDASSDPAEAALAAHLVAVAAKEVGKGALGQTLRRRAEAHGERLEPAARVELLYDVAPFCGTASKSWRQRSSRRPDGSMCRRPHTGAPRWHRPPCS